jgi:hypothetical protein
MNDEQVTTNASVISFRYPTELRVRIERQAATEYLPSHGRDSEGCCVRLGGTGG